jgi:hypothetical protein
MPYIRPEEASMLRPAIVIALGALLAACGNHAFPSICNSVPPPAACMTACDPSPGAPQTCPLGFYCNPDGKCDAQCTAAGNQCGNGYHCTPDGQCESDNGGCTGLSCQIVDCKAQMKPDTSISGTVFAPNGTLPLYDVNVYVPNSDPGDLPDGAICNKCTDALPGDPIVKTITDESGKFTLSGVPSGANIPLVIVSGKWRRIIKVKTVMSCVDTAVDATDTTLPKSIDDITPNTTKVDMPKIAISTGNADALECLVRKLGIADKEIGTMGSAGHIHLYGDNGATQGAEGRGALGFKAGFPGGTGMFADSKTLWGTVDKLKAYDIVILSCEGGQHPETKPQTAMNALKAYADLGGRVFMSHWHNIWIEGSTQGGGTQKPAVWTGIATWSNGGNTADPATDIIDEMNNPKGASFATWMLNVMGSTIRDQITVHQGRTTCSAVDNTKAERWTYYQPDMSPQNFQFTTPNETTPDQRCGKVVFSDMHVSADSSSAPGTPYPTGCAPGGLTAQEKALAFMFFDLASCVGSVF